MYSTVFPMHVQRGSFNGINTCSITNFGNFDFTSKFSSEAESRAIKNLPGINARLSQLGQQDIL